MMTITSTVRVHQQTKDRIAEMAHRLKKSQADCVKILVDDAWRASGLHMPTQPVLTRSVRSG
jgi:hypothetical protein